MAATIQAALRERLMALTPRGFELFAGDLLTYLGLHNVTITQYSNDGGIDARGEIVGAAGLVMVPTGVQVKRHRHSVGRPDIDRFIGALSDKELFHGIFITTAEYAPKALDKARTSRFVRIDAIGGRQVAALMEREGLGIVAGGGGLDEGYFAGFDAIAGRARLAEPQADYLTGPKAADPADDLISLSALSYALRVDTTTLRRRIEAGGLVPDAHSAQGAAFFQRRHIERIRAELALAALPEDGEGWRQEFLAFAGSRQMRYSYKPVLLLVLLEHMDGQGRAALTTLATAFRDFYLRRVVARRPLEKTGLMARPEQASLEAVKRLIIKYPLDRFLIKNFLEYDRERDEVRFSQPLWAALRYADRYQLETLAWEQIAHYERRAR